jgi:hypothetical protein
MSMWQWRVWPVPVKRLLFKIAPGKWTQAEVDDIRRRAREHAEAMKDLID